jgi:hypothetical protein
MSLPSGRVIGQSFACTDRIEKYIANSPAKNINSLDSHTMVPTLTMLGRVSECTRLESKLDAVLVEVTMALCPAREGSAQRGHSCRAPVATTSEPRAGAGQPADTMRRMSAPAADTVIVLLYSNSAQVRAQVRTAVGRRPAPDSPRIDWLECATNAELVEQMDLGGLDLAILDGEAQPTGGMGLARQFKYEIDDCPPIIVLIARPQDGWLASWSLADAVISQPLDPVTAAQVVADQLRRHLQGIPVVR